MRLGACRGEAAGIGVRLTVAGVRLHWCDGAVLGRI